MRKISLTDQFEAAERYLGSFPENVFRRGETYFIRGRVGKVTPYKSGRGFRVEVAGSRGYAVRLRFRDGEWNGECSCPVGLNCKHCCAAMLELVEDPEEVESGSEPIEASPLPEPQARKPKAARSPRPPKEAGENDPFPDQLRARLNRKLTAAETRAARTVDELHTRYRDSRLVAEYLLDPITGRRGGWNWQSIELWPEPPATRWQAWLFLAALLRRQKWSCPPGLLEVTDWKEVDALLAHWERAKAVRHWQEWLQTVAASPDAEPPAQIDLRVRLTPNGLQLEWRRPGAPDFTPMKQGHLQHLHQEAYRGQLSLPPEAFTIWRAFSGTGGIFHRYDGSETAGLLNRFLRDPALTSRVVGPAGVPLRREEATLRWRMDAPEGERRDYRFSLVMSDGAAPPAALTVVDGQPCLYVTPEAIFTGPPLAGLTWSGPEGVTIPAEALETSAGVQLFDRLGIDPPPQLAARVKTVRLRPIFRCALDPSSYGRGEWLSVRLGAQTETGVTEEEYLREGWQVQARDAESSDLLVRRDRSLLRAAPALLETLRVRWQPYQNVWQREIGKNFPALFAEWLAALPEAVVLELDPLLATLRDAPIEAQVKLEVAEAGIDWFDLRVALDVADTTLTAEELRALLDARGGYVRLGAKGWRRLTFQLDEEEEKQLADLGLNARDFSSKPQRLHALQLAGRRAAARLLPDPQIAAIEKRAAEIQTRVTPPLPAALTATLRPYQLDGFHFLAYLTANRFGGILADDMGLGKTVQTLAWLLWLRENEPAPRSKKKSPRMPSLVVCPKSVIDTWSAEAARFAPDLRVRALIKGNCDAPALQAARAEADLVAINYTQLRLLGDALAGAPWHAVILDEAQCIKNPESQTAQAAYALPASHRLALSGTPIENRLLDLWSIMRFVMPGLLGQRAGFNRAFDQRSDPLARRRLAARVRPFLLRRTKGEVARDLPARTEEDLMCELEGAQAVLYRAELKRARAALLKIQSQKQLDAERFNFLTSLLRLRQICCHPALATGKPAEGESAKLTALFDLLDPLVQEGHKVLVFSQFVGMLEIIAAEIARREWPHFLLTGATEERGPLVERFQATEGAMIFLISLRAGGFGLNLTAASYVVLYDPWWNPAVENQAIDRTHRIGQTKPVIAYRLLVKETIEEKIRLLQKQKRALAADILGEEAFARTLTLDDFRFLFAD